MAMTEKKLLEVIEKYEAFLNPEGLVRVRRSGFVHAHGASPDPQESASHLMWMLSEMRVFLKEGRREKLMRWLGFVQGALWMCGAKSIDEMKRDNMPDEEKVDG